MQMVMHSEIEYRGYAIFHDGHEFVAEPKAVDDTVFEIGSDSIELAMSTIDEMWRYLDSTTSLSQAPPPPAWFQTWIDNGAAGRIRVTEPESFEFEHFRRRRQRCWALKIAQKASYAVCLVSLIYGGMAVADVDGNGMLDREDVATFVDNLHMRTLRSQVIRTVEYEGKDYVMTAVPSPRNDCDFKIHLMASTKGL
jgi:hypothetical protein